MSTQQIDVARAGRERASLGLAAYQAALRRLIDTHREELDEYVRAERVARGLSAERSKDNYWQLKRENEELRRKLAER